MCVCVCRWEDVCVRVCNYNTIKHTVRVNKNYKSKTPAKDQVLLVSSKRKIIIRI